MNRFMRFHKLPHPSRVSKGSLRTVFAFPEHVQVVRAKSINGSRPQNDDRPSGAGTS